MRNGMAWILETKIEIKRNDITLLKKYIKMTKAHNKITKIKIKPVYKTNY